jgi:hypothetical protein
LLAAIAGAFDLDHLMLNHALSCATCANRPGFT